jgi:multidrug resistance protein
VNAVPLLVLFVTAFVDMIGLTMVIPLLPFYATDFGAGATMIGVLISAFSIAQLAVAPSWGRFSDRYGRRPAILAGLLLTAVAYVLFAFAGSIVALLVSRLIQGTGGGTIGVVQAYVADASKPKERTKSLGWLSVVTSMGAVAGPAFGSALISVGGRRAPGLAAAVLSVLVAVFAWRFLRESSELRQTTSHPAASPQTSRGAILRVLTRWREPAPRLIWIYTIAIGAFYGTIQTVPLLLSSRFSVTESNIGYFIMYLGGMGVLVRSLLLGRMVDRLGEARLSRIGIVILALGLASTGLATGYPLLAAGFTLMPVGTAFIFPCVTGLLSTVVAANERGLYMGVQHTFGGASRVAFPILAGFLMDHAGVGVPFWLSAILVLVTLPLTATLARHVLDKNRTTGDPLASALDEMTGEYPVTGSASNAAPPAGSA